MSQLKEIKAVLVRAQQELGRARKDLMSLVCARVISSDRGQMLYTRMLFLSGDIHSSAEMLQYTDVVPHLDLIIEKLADVRHELELLSFHNLGIQIGVARELVRDARGPLKALEELAA